MAGKRRTDKGAGPMDPLWGDAAADARDQDEALVVDIAGFEGPLDLLLHLARNQRVDLARISVLALAEQYIAFIDRARSVRIELAADYLVMAAWLAFLKSRLLLPRQPRDDGPSGEELALQLAFRLKRLEAIRDAAMRLMNRNRLGRDVHPRGAPEHAPVERPAGFEASLYDLLTAYAGLRQRQAVSLVTIERRQVWSLAQARLVLARLIGDLTDWTALDQYLIAYIDDPKERATVTASAFAASLEMVREGRLEMRQDGAYRPIYMRQGSRPYTPEALAALEADLD